MKNKEKLKKNTGITLIALVLSIIVILILSGMLIAMLTRENRNNNKCNYSKKSNWDSWARRKNKTSSIKCKNWRIRKNKKSSSIRKRIK